MFSKNFICQILLTSFLPNFVTCEGIKFKTSYLANSQDDEFLYDYFPAEFYWGTATSAYQTEGAWKSYGEITGLANPCYYNNTGQCAKKIENLKAKGMSNWDFWTHENNGSNIAKGHNGDVACDSYHKFNQDIALMKNMGATSYRFSISWARIVPTGRVIDGINQVGIDHYRDVIDALLNAGIEPFLTIYHWDLPMPLVQDGAWLNESIVNHFVDYSRILFREYGDRVKFWLTFNEPHVFCQYEWQYAKHNFLQDPPVEPYICAHNVVKSHAKAYRMYDQEFRLEQQGQIGITLNCDWPERKDPSNQTHVDASDRSMHFHYGWWANPLSRGEYPPVMREILDKKSQAEGRNSSRLPTFDEEWTKIINGTFDFFGLNHYYSYLVSPNNGSSRWLIADADIMQENDPSWNRTALNSPITPFGLRKVLTWINKEYGNPPIYVTENGYAGYETDGVDDPVRVDFYKNYINQMLKSIKWDGSNVKGYAAWTLMDNMEWVFGYTIRFGVNYVNFTDPDLPRTPKLSAGLLNQIFTNNGFPPP